MKIVELTGKAGIAVLLLALAGCERRDPDLMAMRMELNALKLELEYVRHQAEDLEPRVQSTEQMALQAFDEREAPARLDCTGGSQGALPTRLAVLSAVCEKLVAHEGGHLMRLRVGNPTTARLERLSLTFYAGDGAARGRSERRLHHVANVALPPGAWKSIEIELDGVDAEGARDLAVRADVGAVTLASR